MVTHRVPLTSIAEAFEIYVGRRDDALKVMLEVCTDAVRSAPEGEAERALVARMVALAEELIASFDPLLRRRVWLRPFASEDTEAERKRWFYTPTDHGGVELSAMTPRQQSLTMQLLASGLTREAYVAVCVVLGMENVLDELEGWGVEWGRERGRDPGLYWLRIFGRPGDGFWGWRFGGHHVSVNLLLHEGRVVAATPCFIGADPASSSMLSGTLRPLGASEDLARELMQSLAPDQREQTVLHPRAVSDIVSGNRPRVADGDQMMHMQVLFRGSLSEPRLRRMVDRIDEVAESQSGYDASDHARVALDSAAGLRATDMTPGQRDLLVARVDDYLARATSRSPSVAERSTGPRQGSTTCGSAGRGAPRPASPSTTV